MSGKNDDSVAMENTDMPKCNKVSSGGGGKLGIILVRVCRPVF